MLLLANENFPRAAVDALKEADHDVVWVRTEIPGATDQEVLRLAQKTNRILLTFDKDFGELAFREGMAASCGIILFRVTPSSPEYISKIAVAALQTETTWSGHFAVVEENRIRVTVLPA